VAVAVTIPRTEAEREHAARHRTPEAVLAETAMMDF
jgi:hypothetical protein